MFSLYKWITVLIVGLVQNNASFRARAYEYQQLLWALIESKQFPYLHFPHCLESSFPAEKTAYLTITAFQKELTTPQSSRSQQQKEGGRVLNGS